MNAPRLTKKQKKGLAFRERKGRKPRLAVLDEELAVPQADPPVEGERDESEVEPGDGQPDAVLVSGAAAAASSSSKKRKRARGHGEKDVGDDTLDGGVPGESATGENVDEQRRDTTGRKTKRRKVNDEDAGEENTRTVAGGGKSRFILFVGNLKYTTSLAEIQEHFASCDPPPHIRLLTPKPKPQPQAPAASTPRTPTKSKGCAFLEFSHRNALQQGLKLHGSTLDGRRINVELTAGGGGKSENRVQKVQARNKHLLEERKARVQKAAEKGAGADTDALWIAPPQRHSTTSGLEEAPQKRRTWTVPEAGEVSGRGGVKKRGKKGKGVPRSMGTGANAVAVG